MRTISREQVRLCPSSVLLLKTVWNSSATVHYEYLWMMTFSSIDLRESSAKKTPCLLSTCCQNRVGTASWARWYHVRNNRVSAEYASIMVRTWTWVLINNSTQMKLFFHYHKRYSYFRMLLQTDLPLSLTALKAYSENLYFHTIPDPVASTPPSTPSTWRAHEIPDTRRWNSVNKSTVPASNTAWSMSAPHVDHARYLTLPYFLKILGTNVSLMVSVLGMLAESLEYLNGRENKIPNVPNGQRLLKSEVSYGMSGW